jgi:acetyltransferase-like isoleucine patch superfamily enzyme
MEKKGRKRMTQAFGYSSEDKSLKRWAEIRSRKIVARNFIVMTLSKFLPDTEWKNRIYRKTGMKIGKNVSIFGSNLDIFFPELIEIGDGSVIGNKTAIITHEFLPNQWRRGPIKIGKNVTIGTMTVVLPGVTIGDNSTVAAYSLVNKDVEPGTLVGGVPIKVLKR